jgi:crossover junction endodeoxyribonuclease RusA
MKQMDVALDPMAGCGPTIQFDLPWPGRELSPNARLHHMAHYRAKKSFRNTCFLATKKAGIALGATPYRMDLVFFPPNARRRDRDNLLASMKSGIDGMAQALGVDDTIFDPISVSVSPLGTYAGNGNVRVYLTPNWSKA